MPTFEFQGLDRPVQMPDDWSSDRILEEVNKIKLQLYGPAKSKESEQGRLSSAVQTFGREFVGGVGEVMKGAGRLQTFLETPIEEPTEPSANPTPESTNDRQRRMDENALIQYGEALRQGAQEDYKTNPRYQGEFWSDVIPQALASTAVAAAAGAVGGPLVGGLAYGLQQGEDMALEAEDKGHPENADLALLGGMAIGSLSEGALGVSQKALGIYKKLKAAGVDDAAVVPMLKKIVGNEVVKSTAQEAVQEGIEQVGQNIIAKELYDPNRTLGQDVGQSILAGGVVGGLVSGGAAGLGRLARSSERAKKEAELAAIQNDAPATAAAIAQTPTEVPQPVAPAPKPSVTLQTPAVDTSAMLDELDSVVDSAVAATPNDPAAVQYAVTEHLKKIAPEVDQTSEEKTWTTQGESKPQPNTQDANTQPSPMALPGGESPGTAAQVAEGGTSKVLGTPNAQEEEAGARVPRQTPIDTGTTPIAGVGPIGQTKAWIDDDRLIRGVASIDPELVQEHGPVIAEAHRELQNNPEAGLDAIDRALNSPEREISIGDRALVFAYDIGLRRQRALLESQASDPLSTPESRAAAQTELQVVADQLDMVDRALRRQGSTWGRFGRFMQRMANSDFTLVSLIKSFEEAKQEPLTKAELDQLSADAKKDQEISDEIEKKTEEQRKADVQASFEEAVKQDLGEVRTTPEEDPRVASLAERLVVFLENQAASARRRLRERLGGTSTLGLDILADYSIIGAAHIARGALTVGKFTAAMVNEFGEDIRQHIPQIWEASNKHLDSVVEKNAGKGETKKVRQKLAEKTPLQNIEDAKTGIKERLDDGESEESLRTLFGKIRRNMVASGIHDVQKLIDAIHEVVKPIMPGLSRDRVAELASNYGRFTPLSKDELSVRDRDLKGQLLVTAQIQAMQKGQAPKATGVEREMSSADKRKLLKLREELKKKGGYTVTDPARQLKTAQDAIKTRLQNEIDDIDRAIEKNERIPNKKRSVTYTDEMEALRDLRNQKRAEYVALFPPPDLTDAQKADRYARSLDRNIERLTAYIRDGEQRNQSKTESPWRPDIAEKQRILKDLVAIRQDVRDRNVAAIREKQNKAAMRSIDRSISQIEDEIKNGRLRPWNKKNTATSPEIAAKKARLDEAKALRHFVRMADVAARENDEIVRLVARRTAAQERLAGSTETREKDKPLSTPEIEKIRQEIKEINSQIAEKAKGPKISPEDLALARKAARLQSSVAKLREEALKTEFPPKPKKAKGKVDDEILGLQREQAQLRSKINERKAEYALKQRDLLQKIKDWTLEGFGLVRAGKLGYEASVFTLQGGFYSATHPYKASKAAFKFFKALRSQEFADKVSEQIKNHPLYQTAVNSGLVFYDLDDMRVSKMNEMYIGRWAKKLPLNEAFHRASNAFLNTAKMDMFSTFYTGFMFRNGVTPDQAKVMANFVNLATGYSKLGIFERSADAFAKVFLAPRYGVSTFRLMNPLAWAFDWRGGVKVKAALSAAMVQFLAAISLFTMALAAYYDVPLETDPRSSDFLTIHAGPQRIDLLGGFKKPINFYARALTLSTKTKDGEIRSLYDTNSGDLASNIGQILRGSLSIGPGAALTLATGRNPAHQPEGPLQTIAGLGANMSWSDIKDTLTKEGVQDRILPVILSLIGARVNYDENY